MDKKLRNKKRIANVFLALGFSTLFLPLFVTNFRYDKMILAAGLVCFLVSMILSLGRKEEG